MLGPALLQLQSDLRKIPEPSSYEKELLEELQTVFDILEAAYITTSMKRTRLPSLYAQKLSAWAPMIFVDRNPSDIVRMHCDCPDCPNKRLGDG